MFKCNMLHMKILYVCPTSEFYGDGKALLNIMPHLVSFGIEPVFIIPNEGEFTLKLKEYGYKYVVSHFGSWTTYKGKLSFRIVLAFIYNYLRELPKYETLVKIVKDIKPDAIHTNCTTSLIGYRLSKELGVPHVWHIREYGLLDHKWNHFPSKTRFEKLYSKPLNYSISITKDIFKYNGSPRNGIVIYDGVFDSNKIPIINDTDEGYFLYVGRIITSKGIIELIETYKKYIDNIKTPCRLKIAGEGFLIPHLREWIKLNNLEKYIELLGYRDDVSVLMSKARCLFVPSPNEAFGFITAEAMYNGCIVVGKNTAGTKMQFDNCCSIIGYDVFYRYLTSSELYNIMWEVTFANKREVMTDLLKAQKCVLSLYSVQSSAQSVYKYYKSFLSV